MNDLATPLRAQLHNRYIGCDVLTIAIEDVLGLHVVDARYSAISGLAFCRECGKHWPCPTTQIIVKATDVSPAADK